jgi:hypothetical protein
MSKKRDLERDAALLFEDRTAPPGAGWGDLTRFIESARERLPVEPDDRTRALHLAAIDAALLEDRTAVGTRRRRSLMDRTRPALARLALAVATLTGGTAGLAYAGVDLPGQAAEKAFAAVGVELPNQEETTETEAIETEDVTISTHGQSVAELVRNVILNRDTFASSCEFGQAVAEAAGSNNQGQGGNDNDPCSQEDLEPTGGSSSTGQDKSAEGKAKAEQNQGDAGSDGAAGSSSTGQDKSAEGKAKAEQNRAGADGVEASAGGRTKADENKGGPTGDE